MQGGTMADVEDEVRRVVEFVEETTGLRSRWNGQVIILEESEIQTRQGRGALGEKQWNCGILIHAALQDNLLRWRTLLHEALHSVSAGLTEEDYRRFRGWEEGVVECLQRRWRPELLQTLGGEVPEGAFEVSERFWPLNGYLEALQALQEATGREPEMFYRDLLRTPLALRLATVRSWGSEPGFLSLLAHTIGKLR